MSYIPEGGKKIPQVLSENASSFCHSNSSKQYIHNFYYQFINSTSPHITNIQDSTCSILCSMKASVELIKQYYTT
jgi:hypothetical protein